MEKTCKTGSNRLPRDLLPGSYGHPPRHPISLGLHPYFTAESPPAAPKDAASEWMSESSHV